MKKAAYFSVQVQQHILAAVCFLQVLVFVYTGCSKLLDQHNFEAQLSLVLPWPTAAAICSYSIPLAELLVAAGILFQQSRLAAMYAFCFLLFVFTAYIVVALLGTQALPCSCGGVISSLSWQQHLLFNSILILLSITGIYLQHHSKPT